MSELQVDLSQFQNWLSFKNKFGRGLWNVIYLFFFRPFSPSFCNPWRLFLLRCFGSKLHTKSHVHSSVRIWAPWNL